LIIERSTEVEQPNSTWPTEAIVRRLQQDARIGDLPPSGLASADMVKAFAEALMGATHSSAAMR